MERRQFERFPMSNFVTYKYTPVSTLMVLFNFPECEEAAKAAIP